MITHYLKIAFRNLLKYNYPEAERSYLVYTQTENNNGGYSPHVLPQFIREYCPEAEVNPN